MLSVLTYPNVYKVQSQENELEHLCDQREPPVITTVLARGDSKHNHGSRGPLPLIGNAVCIGSQHCHIKSSSHVLSKPPWSQPKDALDTLCQLLVTCIYPPIAQSCQHNMQMGMRSPVLSRLPWPRYLPLGAPTMAQVVAAAINQDGCAAILPTLESAHCFPT